MQTLMARCRCSTARAWRGGGGVLGGETLHPCFSAQQSYHAYLTHSLSLLLLAAFLEGCLVSSQQSTTYVGESWCSISMMQADQSDEDGYGLEAARQALELSINAPSGGILFLVLMVHQAEI